MLLHNNHFKIFSTGQQTLLLIFIVAIQSVIDFAVGVLGISSFLVYMLGKMGTYSNCAASLFGHTMTILMIDISTIVVSAMTLERYIAVLHPFVYKLVVTKNEFCCAIVILVVVALSLVFRRLMDGWIIVQSTIFFLFTAFAYTRIFLLVKILTHTQVGKSATPKLTSLIHFTKT